jgi:hypothetical protein
MMALSDAQHKKISLLSDTVLYEEAINFLNRFLEGVYNEPLPTSQITGLLNIALGPSYDDISRFIRNQHNRNWPDKKEYIKRFYTDLETYLARLRKRLADEFQLTTPNLTAHKATQEKGELMLQLTREFIQHLAAENNLLLQQQEEQQRRDSNGRTRTGY